MDPSVSLVDYCSMELESSNDQILSKVLATLLQTCWLASQMGLVPVHSCLSAAQKHSS
jgi:hypothetical protein